MNPLEDLLQAYLDANGYEDYRVVIEIPKREIDNSEQDPNKAELVKDLSDMIDDMWGGESA